MRFENNLTLSFQNVPARLCAKPRTEAAFPSMQTTSRTPQTQKMITRLKALSKRAAHPVIKARVERANSTPKLAQYLVAVPFRSGVTCRL
ncbi:hypothetical protein CcaverHIS641_0407020 [Cutaneotrichosporon cavernicola]|nr:hypothetical protein CcaverHIS641_0407020 [Cutaneotrichosporon cavernicola]